MHDELLRRALESKKTVSRKAKAKAPSVASSKKNSPAASRAASHAGSEDDESNFSGDTLSRRWSSDSLDDDADHDDAPLGAWITDLNDRIAQLTDRKKSSVQGREETLRAFSHILVFHYAAQQVRPHMSSLISALLKCVKSGQTEREITLAFKALTVLLVTEPSDHIYDAIAPTAKQMASDSEDTTVKVAALHALGAATFYGGAATSEVEDVMEYFLEIVTSDGHFIDAPDSADVVTAALEEWGLLATKLGPMEDTSEDPMDSFVDQLESSFVKVQVAAGENIALLFEKSWSRIRDDEDEPERKPIEPIGPDDNEPEPVDPSSVGMVKRYTVYRQEHRLLETLEELSKMPARHLSKKDKRSLHSNFLDIRNSVELPTRGPRYSLAKRKADPRSKEPTGILGSRASITIGIHTFAIDKWWKQIRLNSLRRVLQGGFLVHYEDNPVIFDSLPLVETDSDDE